MKLNKNLNDQSAKKVAYKFPIPGKYLKMAKILHKKDPSFTSDLVPKNETLREYFEETIEKEKYGDIEKVRVKSLRKLLGLLLYLKEHLKLRYKNEDGDILICRIQDMNVNDVPSEILELLEMSSRSLYDYLKTLKMILDYSHY